MVISGVCMQQVDALATGAEFRVCCGLSQRYIASRSNTKILVQDGYLILRCVFVGFGRCLRIQTKNSDWHQHQGG